MMKHITLIILLTFQPIILKSEETNYCVWWERISWNKISYISDQTYYEKVSLSKFCSRKSISLTMANVTKEIEFQTPYQEVNLVINGLSNKFDVLDLLLLQFLRAFSIMIIVEEREYDDAIIYAQNVNLTSAFLLLRGSHTLYTIYTFLDQPEIIVNEWYINGFGKFKEKINFHGQAITSSALPWPPFFTMEKCDRPTDKCETGGLLADMMILLEDYYNFTLEVYREPNDNWGLLPVRGNWSHPDEAIFDGVLGNVIQRRNSIAMSVWDHYYHRHFVVDTTMSLFQKYRAPFINKKVQMVDVTLFLRPFVLHVWLAVLALVIISQLPIVMECFAYRSSSLAPKNRTRKRISVIVGICFVLLQSFYGGALTMFFSSPTDVPFSDIYEALDLYPSWKLVITEDTASIYYNLKSEGEKYKSVKEFLNRLEKDEGTILKSNLEIIFEHLLTPGYYFNGGVFELSNYLKSHQISKSLELHRVGKGLEESACLLLSRNSPYTKMINEGILKIKQNGMIDMLLNQYVTDFPKTSQPVTLILKLGHTAAIFTGYAFVAGLSLCILLLEQLRK